jgi:uncharacterized protein (DUF58 family)
MPARSRKYHIDSAASMYVGVTFIVGLGAFYSQNNLLYVIFAMALAAMLVSGAVGGASLMRIDARRLPPSSATVGAPATVRYRVVNRARWLGAFALEIAEDPAPRRRDPWQAHMNRPGAFAARVAPGGALIVEGVALPTRRGEARLAAVRISSRYPFGIVRKSVRYEQPGSILVRPRPIPPPRDLLDRAAARPARRAGERRTRGFGSEPEFVGLREYVPGDSPRQIAWRASARRDELVVREHAASARAALWAVLCLTADDDEANERAISCAAGVILEGARRAMRVGLAVPGLGYSRPPAGAGAGSSNEHIATLLDDLARIECASLDPAAQAGWMARSEGAIVCIRAAGALLPGLDGGAAVLDADEAAQGAAPAEVAA